MNNKILYGLIGVAFVGGMFTVAYAGPIIPKITLSGDVDVTGDTTLQGDAHVAAGKSLFADTIQPESDFFVNIPSDFNVEGFAGFGKTITIFQGLVNCINDQLGNSFDCLDGSMIVAETVTSNEIAAGAVGASEIADGAVVGGLGGDIADGTIKGVDIAVGAIGGVEIGANAVGAGEIRTDAVRADEIQANAVGTSEIADNAVTAAKIAPGATFSGWERNIDSSPNTMIAPGTFLIQSSTCSPGKKVLGGGYTLTNNSPDLVVSNNIAFGDTAWDVVVDNVGSVSHLTILTVGSICALVP